MRRSQRFAGQPIATEGVEVWNPVFDVTPAGLIAGIITEHGVLRPPYEALVERDRAARLDVSRRWHD